jgi:hypothetical protein
MRHSECTSTGNERSRASAGQTHVPLKSAAEIDLVGLDDAVETLRVHNLAVFVKDGPGVA